MGQDWTRRYLIPTDAPHFNQWKLQYGAYQGVTVSNKKPVGHEVKRPRFNAASF